MKDRKQIVRGGVQLQQRRRMLKAAAGGAALSALGFPAVTRSQTGPLKVGIILPLSGYLSAIGLASRRGCDVALKMFSDEGIKLDATFIDTESKPENGRVAAQRAIQDGATILVGAIDTAATIGVAQVCEAAKIPLVINEASAPQITEQGFTYIFRNFTPATLLVTNAVQRIKELPRGQGFNPKTAVVMHVNDTFGQSMYKSVTGLWEKLGVDIRILETVSYDPRARDISVEVAKAKAVGADILCPISRTNDSILLVREMVKQDFNPSAIIAPGSPGGYEKEFTTALGRYAEGYVVCLPWQDPSQALTKRVLTRYRKEYPNDRFVMDDGFGWEGVQVVTDAYRRAKSNRPADLHAALKTTNIKEHIMFGGPIAFDSKGQNNNINGAMMQIQNSEPVVIGPSSIAEGRPRLPMAPWNSRT